MAQFMRDNIVDRSQVLMNIILEPDPRLHCKSEDVEIVDDALRSFMDDMLFTMKENNGIGLAAVQVGVLKKVIVVDITRSDDSVPVDGMPMFLVNAKVIKCSNDKSSFHEGCLSLPDIYADVQRPSDIVVEYLDYYGDKHVLELQHGLLSVCIQHEIDHTNGIIFTDHISKIKRDMLVKKMLKARKKSNA
ncbi:peptide deformylase [Candidatus Lariskella endosymbiont of Hedychridium roseum]|uniref:peptide deformylase n=1 Tax=Candidatus Lariskella endosymbiont of Hedychridium roseum TaxID=3077949 RepID=UPI0030CE6BD6